MSEHLTKIIVDAIDDFLKSNGYMTIAPNMLSTDTQRELAIHIEKAISNYIGRIK